MSSTFITEENTYYCRQPLIILSAEETRLFALLEQLYHRLSALTELEEVDLRVFDFGPDSNPTSEYSDYFYPGMNLGDPATGRPRYLDLLKGWKKLRTLDGSIRAVTSKSKVIMGVEEAAWIGEHWLALRSAMFFL